MAFRRDDELMSGMERVLDFYKESLRHSPSTLDLLWSMRIGEDEISRFEIGYAPSEGDALVREFSQTSYMDCLCEDGLIFRGKGVAKSCDTLVDRLVFPIMGKPNNVRGILGFLGVSLPNTDGKGDYCVVGPDRFSHERRLYNLDPAQAAIYNAQEVFLVGDVFDVIAMGQVGIHNVVSPCGIQIDDEHADILAKNFRKFKIKLCLDYWRLARDKDIPPAQMLVNLGRRVIERGDEDRFYVAGDFNPSHEIHGFFDSGLLGETCLLEQVFLDMGVAKGLDKPGSFTMDVKRDMLEDLRVFLGDMPAQTFFRISRKFGKYLRIPPEQVHNYLVQRKLDNRARKTRLIYRRDCEWDVIHKLLKHGRVLRDSLASKIDPTQFDTSEARCALLYLKEDQGDFLVPRGDLFHRQASSNLVQAILSYAERERILLNKVALEQMISGTRFVPSPLEEDTSQAISEVYRLAYNERLRARTRDMGFQDVLDLIKKRERNGD